MQVFIAGTNTLDFIKIASVEQGRWIANSVCGEIAFLNHIFSLCVFFFSRLLAEEKSSSDDSSRRCAEECIYSTNWNNKVMRWRYG